MAIGTVVKVVVTDDLLASWPRPLAFVLSGGGSYGATHVGMLLALAERSISPDLVVGTSIGALNGAVVAADPAGAPAELARIWTSLTPSTLFGTSRLRAAGALLRFRKSLCPPEGLAAIIEARLGVDTFEELAVPMAVVATDAAAGEARLLTTGRLTPALLASAAIPGVFPPVEIDGVIYVDGGVAANVPVRQAIAFGAKSAIVLNANPATLTGKVPTSMFGAILHASAVMLRSQRADDVSDLRDEYPILTLPQATPSTLKSFDFRSTGALIEAARDRARARLANGAD